MKILIYIFIFIFTPPLFAVECCQYQISPGEIFLLWDGSEQVVDNNIIVTASRTNSFNMRCVRVNCASVYVDFGKGQSSSYERYVTFNNHNLFYNLVKDRNSNITLTLKEDATSKSSYFKERLKYDRPETLNIYAKYLPPLNGEGFLQKGTYSDQVPVRIYPRNNVYNQFITATLPINFYVPPILELSLVDTGAPFDPNDTNQILEFGELTTNDSQGFDIRVKSNAGVSLSLSSANNGKMKHINASDTIDYTFSIDGISYDLSHAQGSPTHVLSRSGVTPENGLGFHATITIGNVANKYFGEYQDTITITAMTID